MNMEEKEKLVKQIKSTVINKIDIDKDVDDYEVHELVTEVVFNEAKKQYLSINDRKEIIDIIFNSIRRLDAIQPLIEDKSITEIMVNGPEDIFIEKAGKVFKIDKTFESKEKLNDVIQNIVSKVNRIVNESSPIVDARLKDGSRVNVVLPPIALNGPILTIRKFPEKPMTMDDLIRFGSLPVNAADFLHNLVKAKYNIFISGGTGSGKTTFLNALSNFIPKDERVITIEDSAELQIIGVENLVRLETRNANMEGKGAILMKDLIKSSLRMRPERIVVGEVRGAEALDMLQAMNTGHDGSLSTGHANSTRDMLSRIETMVLQGADFPLDAIRQQIASAVDIIIQLSRLRDKSRRTVEICEILGYENGKFEINPLYTFVEEGETEEGKIIGSLKRTENKMINTVKLKMAGLSIDW